MSKSYTGHAERVVASGTRFKHVMAITLNPLKGYKEGIIRCITSREGEEGIAGQIDRSVLHKIQGKTLKRFEIKEELRIGSQEKIIKKISDKSYDFLGLEDPDIWVDDKTKLLHVYFTIPLIGKRISKIYLGHAVGKNLDTLVMTMPVITPDKRGGAKEVSIAPLNSKGFRYNLVESSDKIKDTHYSVVRVAAATDMGKPWKLGKIAFHPAKHNLKWIAGHASPGPLLPVSFIDIGPNKRVGLMNGCEANRIIKGKTKYGAFSVGLFIYDFEKGKIEWISPKPYIQDTQASKIRAITFASQFVETKKGEGIMYAHVNDSFVRGYTLKADALSKLLPKS